MSQYSSRRRFFGLHRLLAVLLVGLMATVAPPAASQIDTPEQRLLTAAGRADIAGVRLALDEGAAIDARHASTGSTALMLATEHNHIAVAKLLIEAGADVNAQNHMRNSPYLYAGARGLDEILTLTLAHGANLKSTNRFDGTALIPAAERGHVQTVRILIDAGTDLDHVNRLGWTALLEAILLGNGGPDHINIVRQLVQAGANVNLADHAGVTPLQHAKQRGFREIERILEQAGGR